MGAGKVSVRFFRKQAKPRIFLGRLAVLPQAGLAAGFEDLQSGGRDELTEKLETHLRLIFDLPNAGMIDTPTKTDLGLDVFVPSFRTGELAEIDFFRFAFVVFWRPKVELRAKLYELKSNDTVETVLIVQRPPWRDYLKGAVNYYVNPFQLRLYGEDEMVHLLEKAAVRLLEKITKAA